MAHSPSVPVMDLCGLNGCSFVATSEALMKQHKETPHDKWPCFYCLFEAQSFGDHRQHMSQHEDEKHCGKCGYDAPTHEMLRDHINENHYGRYECNECDATFAQSHNLSRHKNSAHKGSGNNICADCGWIGRKDNMTNHAKIDHSLQELCLLCADADNKIYKTRVALSQHIRSNHGDETVCKDCGFEQHQCKNWCFI